MRRPVIGNEMIGRIGVAEVNREPFGPVRRLELHARIARALRGDPAPRIAIDDEDTVGVELARRHRAAELAQVEGARFPTRDHDEAGDADHFGAASLASASFLTRAWMPSNMSRPGGHLRATHSALRKAWADTSRR